MPSERIQRQIDALLDEADEAVRGTQWDEVRRLCDAVLRLDPGNEDALAYLEAAGRDTVAGVETSRGGPDRSVENAQHPIPIPEQRHPDSFAGGRYRVERFLGEGGKKRVFLAYDSTLDRPVAFGQFRTEGIDAAGRARITQEAQAMGRVGGHPNLVAIYDIGEEQGTPFIVQEYVSGGSIADLLGDGPLPLDQSLRLATGVCDALTFIHEQNLVHRDIKPSNVFLTEDGSAKVGDFGLAVGLDRTRITMQGGMIGTPSYMPPEQALAGDVTPQSDLYSLGATLYELVTGRPPFVGDDPTSVISQHINTPPVAPSWHSEHCPPGLEALILSLLEKDPSKRPASAAEVATALAQVDPEETSARHSGSGDNPLEALARGVFVGRESELERLRTAFDEAFAGRGSVVMLVGEPGIGKTRTTQELETYARMRGARVLWGRAHEASGAPAYWPWIQVGNNHARFVPPGELAPDLDQSQVDELGRIFPALQAANPQPITDPAAAQFRLFDAYTAFMRAGSERAPLVIVLDDLHWADAPSLLLLQHMARELPRMRILVVGTFRDTDLTRTHPLSAALAELNREGGSQRVVLRGLSEGEVATYIRAVAGTEPSPALVGRIYEETEGNPFFLSEVVNLMAQEGGFDGRSDVVIPDGVREAIGRRLNLLSEEANELLTTAAVVGREFPFDTLALLFDGSNEELVGLINEGLRARVIEELDQPGRYEFTHAQMQETLLAEISTTSRVHLNARIADALERRYGDQAEARASRLAQHFFEASTLSDDYAAKALRYSRLAAERAEEQSGWGEAARHYEHALTLVSGSSADLGANRADLLLAQGTCLNNTNTQRPAWRALMEAVNLYSEGGDAVGLARAVQQAARIEAPIARLTALLEQAIEALDGSDELILEGQLRAEFFRLGMPGTNDAEFGARQRDRIVEIVERTSSPELAAQLLVVEAWLARPDMGVRAHAFLDAHRALAEAGASQAASYWGYQAVAVGTASGVFELGNRIASEAIRFAADHGYRYDEENGAAMWSLALLARGDFAAYDELRRSRPNDHEWFARLTEVVRHEMTGDLDRALELLPDVGVAIGPGVLAVLLGSRARVFAVAGDESRAKRELDRIRDEVPWLGEPVADLTIQQKNNALYQLSSIDEAYELADDGLKHQVAAMLRSEGVLNEGFAWGPPIGRGLLRVYADLLLSIGAVAEAHERYESALDWAASGGWAIEEGRTRHGLAKVAIAEGRVADAVVQLDLAVEIFQRLGAQLYLDRVIASKLELQGGAGSDSQTSLVSLTTSVEEQRPDVASAVAPDGTVTLLFSDIEDSTKHNVELGDDAWMRLLGEHNRLVRDAIASNGGFEVKTEGDAFMVAFQSARDAVRCAQTMQRALEARNGDAERPLRIRIGLHTGEPVREADDFYGTHVVMAARICSQASGGEILVSSLLRDLVTASGEFELKAREAATLKGLEGEHVTYAVGWA